MLICCNNLSPPSLMFPLEVPTMALRNSSNTNRPRQKSIHSQQLQQHSGQSRWNKRRMHGLPPTPTTQIACSTPPLPLAQPPGSWGRVSVALSAL